MVNQAQKTSAVEFPSDCENAYRTRYACFWNFVNWQLPDTVLANIWQVDRGNLRARRVRLSRQPPRWQVIRDESNPVFLAAFQLERLKARKFTGAKPAGPYRNHAGDAVQIATEISLEALKYRNTDDGTFFDLHFKLLGASGKHLTADMDTEDGWKNPRIVSAADTLGLSEDDRRALAMACFGRMLRFFGEGPVGGTIRWARWVEADLTTWLKLTLYHQSAARIIRALTTWVRVESLQLHIKSFSESVEE